MGLPKRCAFHVIHEKSLEKTIEYAAMNNWTGIVPDFNVPRYAPNKFDTSERKKLAEISRIKNIEWGFHAPADDLSLFTSHQPIRDAILAFFKHLIDLARDLSPGPTNFVIHTGNYPSFRNAEGFENTFLIDYSQYYTSKLSELILDLIDYGKPDVIIVLENLRWDDDIRREIPELVDYGLRLCLDIPKLYTKQLQMKKEDFDIFDTYREAIEVVHVHDMFKNGTSHQIVGKGDIDFTLIIEFLTSLTHNPQYVFEVRPKEAAQESLHEFQHIYP